MVDEKTFINRNIVKITVRCSESWVICFPIDFFLKNRAYSNPIWFYLSHPKKLKYRLHAIFSSLKHLLYSIWILSLSDFSSKDISQRPQFLLIIKYKDHF